MPDHSPVTAQARAPHLSYAPWIEASRLRIGTLTDRESEVLWQLAQGLDNRKIARRLGLAERTAQRHLSQVLAKLGCESRLQAGLVALVEQITHC